MLTNQIFYVMMRSGMMLCDAVWDYVMRYVWRECSQITWDDSGERKRVAGGSSESPPCATQTT